MADLRDVQSSLSRWRQAQAHADAHRDDVMRSIRPLREARGLGLRETARLAAVSPASLSSVESGVRQERFGLDAAQRVLNAIASAPAREVPHAR